MVMNLWYYQHNTKKEDMQIKLLHKKTPSQYYGERNNFLLLTGDLLELAG
jgi:hypothetical protein